MVHEKPVINARAKGTICGVLAVLFWSFSAPIIASTSEVNPFLFVGVEHGIGVGVLLLKWLLTRENPLPQFRSAPLWFLIAGLIGISVHELTWVAAIHEAPPLEATLLIYLWPLLVVIFTAVAQKKKLYWFHYTGCALGFTGIAALLAGRGLSLGHFALLPGHVWGLVSALTWSIFAAICARSQDLSTNLLGLVFFFSSTINLAIWYWISGAPPCSTSSIILVAASGTLITSGYLLWDYGMREGNAQLVGVVSFLTPVLGAVYLAILGMANFNRYTLAALGFVMLAICVAKYGENMRLFRADQ